ncbi:hypothetical protein [Pseudomonas shirazensis]|uniref:hypothetical protein n=1 Tax=Pseudomonas shirazensis TaxID=2745494 RepID=UPI003D26B0E6
MTDKTSHDLEVLPKRNLFVFPDNMDAANRAAAKECHVFAMAAASAAFNPLAQTEEWFQNYTSVMQQCGWLTVHYKTEIVTNGGLAMDISNLVGKALQLAVGSMGAGVGDSVKKAGEAALEAIANAPEAVNLFTHDATEVDGSTLTLAQCEQSAGGEITMFLVSIQSDGDPVMEHKNKLFSWSYHSKVTVTNTAALVFHRGLYEAVRDVLVSRVTSQSRTSLLTMALKL